MKSVLAAALALTLFVSIDAAPAIAAEATPTFEVDPFWPKALPNQYLNGDPGGVYVDAQDHVWMIHRPKTIAKDMGTVGDPKNPAEAECCRPAPSVIEFDADGKFVQAWGGPSPDGKYDWPQPEHGIFVDYKNNVWLCGNGGNQCLKFTRDGKFLLQIGKAGQTKGSLDETSLNHPADAAVWPATNEVFIADGYANRRVIVFDADTGKFKRMWGAYGNKPDDSAPRAEPAKRASGPAPQQFDLVHCLKIAKDGLVYVCDRRNNRIQVFTIDGKFVKEGFVAKATLSSGGTVYNLGFSGDPAQKYLVVGDLANGHLRLLDRQTLQEVPGSAFGQTGHGVGQFNGLHALATDSKGNVYVAETRAARLQKFVMKGGGK